MLKEAHSGVKLDDTVEHIVAQIAAPPPPGLPVRHGEAPVESNETGYYKHRLVKGTQYAASSTARPTCTRCRRPWRWPRNTAHVNLVCNVPERIKPTTKSTVVAHLTAIPGSIPPQPTICGALFRRLELLHTPEGIFGLVRNRVTRQFLYHTESGYVNYDVKQQEASGFAFARLITLNSWYAALFKCLMVSMFAVVDHYANFILVLQLFTEPEKQMVVDFGEARWPFAIGWIVMLLLCLLVAGYSAWVEWCVKVGPRVGDLIPQCGLFDTLVTFAAMSCFAFFSVEQQVKDIVIVLHPWKSIQPYAAFKSDGARAYTVGYMDESLFLVENLPGFPALCAQLLMRSFVFIFKCYRLVLFPSVALTASVVSSVGSISYGWRSWFKLLIARRKLHARLVKIVSEHKEEAEASEHGKRQRDAAKKLLTLHFRYWTRRKREEPMSRSVSPSTNEKPECPKCGRDLVSRTSMTSHLTQVMIGDQVRLAEDYVKFHDAKYGPLHAGDVGKVIEIGPDIPICGARLLVSIHHHGEERTWWYDEGSVERLPPTREPTPITEVAHNTRSLSFDATSAIGSEDSELSEEIHHLLARLLQEPPARRRAYATELLRAAEALSRGDSEFADVMRIPSFDSLPRATTPVSEAGDQAVADTLRSRSLPGVVEEDVAAEDAP